MKQKILIAEDDRAIVEVIKIILQEAEYQTLTLEDGKNVVSTVQSEKPDLILLDIWLSGLLFVTTKIRRPARGGLNV